MKTQNTFTSKIATLVYANYTENVDMNNELFKQSELNALVKKDKSILRVDYYFGGVLVGNVIYTGKKALSQIIKMEASISKIYNNMEPEYGSAWFEAKTRNETRGAKINELTDKIAKYTLFVTEDEFDNFGHDFCCSYNEWYK